MNKIKTIMSTPAPNQKKLLPFMEIFALLTGLLLSSLYIIGLGLRTGFYSGLNLDPSLFPEDADLYVVDGYMSLLWTLNYMLENHTATTITALMAIVPILFSLAHGIDIYIWRDKNITRLIALIKYQRLGRVLGRKYKNFVNIFNKEGETRLKKNWPRSITKNSAIHAIRERQEARRDYLRKPTDKTVKIRWAETSAYILSLLFIAPYLLYNFGHFVGNQKSITTQHSKVHVIVVNKELIGDLVAVGPYGIGIIMDDRKPKFIPYDNMGALTSVSHHTQNIWQDLMK